MQKWPDSIKLGKESAFLLMLHNTSGGSRDSAEKELAVIPSSLPPGPRVVMTVTPVGNRPSALRNCLESNGVSSVVLRESIVSTSRRAHEAEPCGGAGTNAGSANPSSRCSTTNCTGSPIRISPAGTSRSRPSARTPSCSSTIAST